MRRIGHHLATRGEREDELRVIAADDVDQPHSVDGRSGAEAEDTASPCEVQRLTWTRHVGHDRVDETGRPGPGEPARQPGADTDQQSRRQLRQLGEVAGTHGLGDLLGARCRPLHGSQPFDGIGDIGRQADDHRRDLVAQIALLGFGAHRDRRHRAQRRGGQFTSIFEVLAERAADHGQGHVVDRRPVDEVAHRLEFGEGEELRVEDAMRA